jgi:hypothetical protein
MFRVIGVKGHFNTKGDYSISESIVFFDFSIARRRYDIV